MEINGKPYYITYAPDGTAMGIVEDDVPYYFETNLQGDVVGILTYTGVKVVSYEYDAWGNVLSITGSRAKTIGQTNPIRYRGYVYDDETGYYYLQSRYYNPDLGRFINADAYASTGQGLLGNNMFAYCNNGPVLFVDTSGTMMASRELNIGYAVGYPDGSTILSDILGLGYLFHLFDLYLKSSKTNKQTSTSAFGSTPASPSPNGNKNNQNDKYNYDGDKTREYVSKRGWTDEMINTAINNGKQGTSINMANGNSCSVYRYPGMDNQYVVIDDITNSIVQVSRFTDPGWKPDSRIVWTP